MAATLTQLDAYLVAGKYAIVRTCPSVDPQDYIDRAAAVGLTGLVFYLGTGDTKLRDADGPLTQWAPNSAGEEWQKLQALLYSPGILSQFKAAGLSIGAFFDTGLGGWEAPGPEGFMYAAIMNNLGEDVSFLMVDISHERWKLGMPTWHDDERPISEGPKYYAGAKATQLIQSAVWNVTPKPRPVYTITGTDPDDYPHLLWHPTGPRSFSPAIDFWAMPFCMPAPRVDPAGGENAVEAKWHWNDTPQKAAMRRGEVVWDLRNTLAPNATHINNAMHLVTDDTLSVTFDAAPYSDFTLTPQCGVQVFDDLDKIEELGFQTVIANGPALGDHWDLEGGGTWMSFQVHLEPTPVPEAVAGQPHEVTMVWENWHSGQTTWVVHIRAVKCSCCKYGTGNSDLEETWIRINDADPPGSGFVAIPPDGRITISGTPAADDVGKWILQWQPGPIIYWVRNLIINVAPAATLPGQPMALPAPVARADKERWPTVHLSKAWWNWPTRRQECFPGLAAAGPPYQPPGPGDIGPGGPTTAFACGSGYSVYNSILNGIWVAANRPSNWEEMAFYIAVMLAESGGVYNAAGDSCPNPALQCIKCITCADSTLPTTCACSFGLYQLNVCGGQGETCTAGMSAADKCTYLLDPASNISCAMTYLKDAWAGCKAAGCTGLALYKCAAEMSGHPGGPNYGGTTYACGGSGGAGEAARQVIAALAACIYANGSPGFPLDEFYLTEPSSASITANCQWHLDNEGFPALDYGCSAPDPIYAAHGGLVVFAGLDPVTAANPGLGKGNYVEIQDAADGQLHTRYCHLSVVSVSAGASVSRGTKAGECGDTGYTFGEHLHFELLSGGVNVCPCGYLEGGC